MHNDKNRLRGDYAPKDPFVGRVAGRSRPSIPTSEDQFPPFQSEVNLSGGRLCDGTLPQNNAKDSTGGCGNDDGGFGCSSRPLAMVYSPLQTFHELYSPEDSLERGTIFKELDLPFDGYKGGKGGCNLC